MLAASALQLYQRTHGLGLHPAHTVYRAAEIENEYGCVKGEDKCANGMVENNGS